MLDFHPLLQTTGGFIHRCLPVDLSALGTQQRTIPTDMLPVHSCSAKFTRKHFSSSFMVWFLSFPLIVQKPLREEDWNI